MAGGLRAKKDGVQEIKPAQGTFLRRDINTAVIFCSASLAKRWAEPFLTPCYGYLLSNFLSGVKPSPRVQGRINLIEVVFLKYWL
jgi:hypothetical protein